MIALVRQWRPKRALADNPYYTQGRLSTLPRPTITTWPWLIPCGIDRSTAGSERQNLSGKGCQDRLLPVGRVLDWSPPEQQPDQHGLI